jgi:hypothetical protein
MENNTLKEANLPTLNWDKLVPFRPILTPYNDAARQCLGSSSIRWMACPLLSNPPSP